MRTTPFINQRGLSLLEVMVAAGVVGVFALVMISYSNVVQISTGLARSMSTRDRILSGVRGVAGMPAALRNSMRASRADGSIVNPELLACAGGNPANSCDDGKVYPLTLYSPLIMMNSAGQPIGIQAITSPFGTANPMRFDNFGVYCQTANQGCALLVYTSFRPKCGPTALPNPPPAVITQKMLEPQKKCTIADVIEVTYQVQLDPALAESNPDLSPFLAPLTGTVAVSVIEISGNVSQ